MIKMDENLKNKYQDVINYENADSMFTALDNLLKENDRKFVLTEEHDTEENCIRSYVLRSNAMRYAADSIEHYSKAILIQNGSTWDESKSWGHNLLELFNNLDEETRSILIVSLMPYNKYDYQNEYSDKEKAIMYLYNLFDKYNLMESPKETTDYNNVYLKYENYDNKNILPIREPVIFQDQNIKPVSSDSSIEQELTKLNPPKIPGTPREQLFGIKSRFPGQYLVEGNAEFLISMAYTLNKISNYYRKQEKTNYHRL